jgi:hypothetical protein
MRLNTTVRILGKYSGKSKFAFWKNIKKGDVLTISTKLTSCTGSSNGLYSPQIKITSVSECGTFDEFTCGWNEAVRYLERCSFDEPSKVN